MFSLRAPVLQLKVHQLAGNPMPPAYGGNRCGKSVNTTRMLAIWLIRQRAANDPIRPLRYV